MGCYSNVNVSDSRIKVPGVIQVQRSQIQDNMTRDFLQGNNRLDPTSLFMPLYLVHYPGFLRNTVPRNTTYVYTLLMYMYTSTT